MNKPTQKQKDKFIQDIRDAYERQDDSLIRDTAGTFFGKYNIPTTVTWHKAKLLTVEGVSNAMLKQTHFW